MGRSSFMASLLLFALLFLSLQQGLGRKLVENGVDALPNANAMEVNQEASIRNTRKLAVEEMDYGDDKPGPNVNSRSGFPFNVPSPTDDKLAPSPTVD